MMYEKLVKIYFLFILLFCLEAYSMTHEKKNFICADEVGPVIEFQIPYFDKGKVSSEFFFKLYYSDDRNLYYNESGAMSKKSSPIDNSYFYYKVQTTIKNEESIMIPPNSFALASSLEYFKMPRNVTGLVTAKSTYARCGLGVPPTVMLKKDGSMFKTLACWNN